MAELKTKQNDGDVKAFLESVEDEKKRAEGFVLLKLFIKGLYIFSKLISAPIVSNENSRNNFKVFTNPVWP